MHGEQTNHSEQICFSCFVLWSEIKEQINALVGARSFTSIS